MASRNKTLAFVAGGVAAGTALLNTARVIAERATVRRLHNEDDPVAGTPFGELPSDRHYMVTATDGTPLYVEEVGAPDAPVTVVFAHGYTLELGCWHYQRLALGDADDPRMRLVFYDQRSHGRSGRSAAEDCTIDQLGSDLEQVIEAATTKDQQVIVVGHSMGGMSIMALADLRPDLFGAKIHGVVLLSTAAGELRVARRENLSTSIAQTLVPAIARTARFAPKWVERSRGLVGDTVWLMIRKYSFGEAGASASLTDYVDRMISSTPLEVVADFYPTLAGHDKLSALPAIAKTSSLVICGDEDRMTPIDHSELIAREMPSADLFVVPGAGHMAMMEKPELCNDQLLGFIRKVTDPVLQRDGKAAKRKRSA